MIKTFKLLFFTLIVSVLLSFNLTAYAADENSYAIKVETKSTSLNIRSGADVSSPVLTTAKKGSYLTAIKKQGKWYKVEYANGKYGYCHSDYIKAVDKSFAARVKLTSGVLNVRKGKGTSYEIKGTLKNGTDIIVLNSDTEWYKILYNGNTTGYVHSKYLTTDFSQKYSLLSLTVPSYKQTDSRWASIKIGTQGGTIKTIGCTTTALAMTESFRKGTFTTPDIMAKSLSYSSSGSLYWPVGYNTELADSNTFLSRIYTILKSGKPVILGAKNNSGTQHWVVVTAHNKSTSVLSADNFNINDPGSSTRNTLTAFLNAYPNVYKIAYYK